MFRWAVHSEDLHSESFENVQTWFLNHEYLLLECWNFFGTVIWRNIYITVEIDEISSVLLIQMSTNIRLPEPFDQSCEITFHATASTRKKKRFIIFTSKQSWKLCERFVVLSDSLQLCLPFHPFRALKFFSCLYKICNVNLYINYWNQCTDRKRIRQIWKFSYYRVL